MSQLNWLPSNLNRSWCRAIKLCSISMAVIITGCSGNVNDAQVSDSSDVRAISKSVQAEPTLAEIKNLVESYAEKRDFSGTVLVARGDNILLEASYGEADIEWGVPNVPEARYRIGSLTKPLIATLIMNMVEDGILSLSGTLGEYLPDHYAGTPAAVVTVEQLLSHTSGLKDFPQDLFDPWWETTARLAYEPEELATQLFKAELIEEPGTNWRYNNSAYAVLGLIVEGVTGKPYGESLKSRIFDPAGMTDSGVFSENVALDRLAHGYAPQPNGELGQPIQVDSSIFFSAAGIYSTARDLYRFDRALYGTDLVSAEAREKMHTKKTDFGYGLGWGLEEWPMPNDSTLKIISHTGSIPGYQSYYMRAEETEDVVIVLNNTNNGSATVEMGRQVMSLLNGKPAVPIKLRLEDLLLPIAHNDGVEAMVKAYENLGDKRSEYDLRERTIIRLGYKLLTRMKRPEDAVGVFEIAVMEHPEAANAHDSLGEAYRAVGRNEEAIRSYQRALDLDPDMSSASSALEELRADLP